MTREEKPNRQIYRQAQVRSLFDSIAQKYDFLNHILSCGIDVLWRRRAIKLVRHLQPKMVLDVATGTADLAIETVKLKPEKVIGIDISERMLDIARNKIKIKKLSDIISLEIGEAEHLRFESGLFDLVMAGFGVRNFENLELGLREFYRVLKDGGSVLILEFSKPRSSPMTQFYWLYSKIAVPLIGGLVSRNKAAYEYLPNTIREFPDGDIFCKILLNAGFSDAVRYPQTFGIATIYIASKKNNKKNER